MRVYYYLIYVHKFHMFLFAYQESNSKKHPRILNSNEYRLNDSNSTDMEVEIKRRMLLYISCYAYPFILTKKFLECLKISTNRLIFHNWLFIFYLNAFLAPYISSRSTNVLFEYQFLNFYSYIYNIGLGRRKFLPKPLPHGINVLLSECGLNCQHEMTEKSATANVNNCIDGIDGNNVDTLDDDDDDDNRVG